MLTVGFCFAVQRQRFKYLSWIILFLFFFFSLLHLFSIFYVLFCIPCKHLQDSKSEQERKRHKPLSSVLNVNAFVYDRFNTELRINDFQQLHSGPINRCEYYRTHTGEEQLYNLQHHYLSRNAANTELDFFILTFL